MALKGAPNPSRGQGAMTRVLTVVDAVVAVVSSIAIVVSFVTFFIYGGQSSSLHGSSLSGYVQDGRCFVVPKGGGSVEVNCDEWRVSSTLGVVAFGSMVLAVLGGGYLGLRALHASMDVSRDPIFAEREQSLRSSGPPLIEKNSGPQD